MVIDANLPQQCEQEMRNLGDHAPDGSSVSFDQYNTTSITRQANVNINIISFRGNIATSTFAHLIPRAKLHSQISPRTDATGIERQINVSLQRPPKHITEKTHVSNADASAVHFGC